MASKSYTNVNSVGVTFNHLRYFNKKSKWGWYGNASLVMNSYETFENANQGFIYKIGGYSYELSLTPGIFFQATPKLMFYSNIGGISFVHDKNGPLRINSSSAGQLNLGIRFHLGRIGKRK